MSPSIQETSDRSRITSEPAVTVAVVDDDEVFAQSLSALVDVLDGFSARVTANSVDAAVAALDAVDVDLALVDVSMPNGGGLAVADAIRRSRNRQSLVVLMSTGVQPAQLPPDVRFVDKAKLDIPTLRGWAASLRS